MDSSLLITPLFPLNLVFFPHTLLPLHIFEPRYLQMTADALEGPGALSMVQLRPRWRGNAEGKPPIFEIATLGRIVHHEKLPSGRYNILLQGIRRLRIVRELELGDKQYRRAAAEPYEEFLDDGSESLQEAQARLLALCHKLAELRPISRRLIDRVMGGFGDPAIFSNQVAGLLANSFAIDGYECQSILEESDIARRIELINVQAQRVIGELLDGAI